MKEWTHGGIQVQLDMSSMGIASDEGSTSVAFDTLPTGLATETE